MHLPFLGSPGARPEFWRCLEWRGFAKRNLWVNNKGILSDCFSPMLHMIHSLNTDSIHWICEIYLFMISCIWRAVSDCTALVVQPEEIKYSKKKLSIFFRFPFIVSFQHPPSHHRLFLRCAFLPLVLSDFLSNSHSLPPLYLRQSLVEYVMKGYNGCVILYGQSTSGEAHPAQACTARQRGIISRTAEDIFNCIHLSEFSFKFLITCLCMKM